MFTNASESRTIQQQLLAVQTFAEEPAAQQVVTERVSALLSKMRDSELFSYELVDELIGWEKDFFSALGTDVKSDELSEYLCYLIEHFISPTITHFDAESQEHPIDNRWKNLLFGFEDEIKRVLSYTLPKDRDLEDYIACYWEDAEEEQQLMLEATILDVVKEARLVVLYEDANAFSDALVADAEALRNRSRAIYAEKMEKGTEALNLVEAQAVKVEGLYSQILTMQPIIEEQLARLARYDADSTHTIHDCQQLIVRSLQGARK